MSRLTHYIESLSQALQHMPAAQLGHIELLLWQAYQRGACILSLIHI